MTKQVGRGWLQILALRPGIRQFAHVFRSMLGDEQSGIVIQLHPGWVHARTGQHRMIGLKPKECESYLRWAVPCQCAECAVVQDLIRCAACGATKSDMRRWIQGRLFDEICCDTRGVRTSVMP